MTARRVGGRIPRPPVDRLLEKCVEGEVFDGLRCWVFTGRLDSGGYSQITVGSNLDNSSVSASGHRVSYGFFVGEVPDGLVIDHLCRVRNCVNPWHMQPVTPRLNTIRGTSPCAVNAQKVSCSKGHPLSGPNLHLTPQGWRVCRVCQRERVRKHRSLRKVAP